MNDHKELIDRLRKAGGGDLGIKMCHDAADAIEQLVADYGILTKMYAKVNEDLCVRTKERDAAVADLKLVCNSVADSTEICDVCKKDGTSSCYAVVCKWEWRGVQEDNNEVG